MQTHIELLFGDGRYTFKLSMRQIVAVEEKCGPIGEVFARLLRGRYITKDNLTVGLPTEGAYKLADCVEVIRQGLIGGGAGEVDGQPVTVSPVTAIRLIETYVDGRPLNEAWGIATAVLSALIEGYAPPEAEPLKKKAERPSGSTGEQSSPTVQ